MAWDWLEKAIDWGGTALDWLGDNEWVTDTITRLAIDHPELDYDKLMEMAIKEAVINSPDIRTPSGSVSWEVDPETGKRTATQQYTPGIQKLFNQLIQNAGAPIDGYRAPNDMGGTFLNELMNERRQHYGLPAGSYEQPLWTKPGVEFSEEDFNYGSPAPTGSGGSAGGPPNGGAMEPPTLIGGGGAPVDGPGGDGNVRDLDRIRELNDFISTRGSGGEWTGRSFNDILNDLVPGGLEGTDPNLGEQLLAEHGDDIGRLIGAITDIPGLGLLGGVLMDMYWKDHQWQSPAPPTEPRFNDLVDQAMYDSPYNFDTLNPQQSPVERGVRWNGDHANIDSRSGPGRANSPWSYAFGQGGPWYRNSGRLLFRPKGF